MGLTTSEDAPVADMRRCVFVFGASACAATASCRDGTRMRSRTHYRHPGIYCRDPTLGWGVRCAVLLHPSRRQPLILGSRGQAPG
ncbi:protein of unknown function [Candidatus Filomicrobium marinum]|uniref:Uncharacterized protein n=1 Tax=Candidatus Filomicrobium marinum TaxID=1608628 RepID=A0A0D6JJ67_9HYPH|nr:protein of unknown function [Candidatus Filomicrobium marinum]